MGGGAPAMESNPMPPMPATLGENDEVEAARKAQLTAQRRQQGRSGTILTSYLDMMRDGAPVYKATTGGA
jgi:hypothetical protein